MVDITLLEEKQVIGDQTSKVFKNLGVKSRITDFAILLGGDVSNKFYTLLPQTLHLDERTAPWATRSVYQNQFFYKIRPDGIYDRGFANDRTVGIRPCTSYSSIKDFGHVAYTTADIPIVNYGWYPQTIVSDNSVVDDLEDAYGELIFGTNNEYTVDSIYKDFPSEPFKPRIFDEFEHPYGSGKRYIRIIGDRNSNGMTLSDGTVVEIGKPYWIKVEPIRWYIDKEMDLAISEKIICAGIQMDNKDTYDGDFEKTNMRKFLDNYFSREIIGKNRIKIVEENSETREETVNVAKKVAVRKENPYEFEVEKVSEEDIIRGAIESNIAVFLHGKSSDGKSARVKQIDPNCEIVYLRNATPDSLNGKSVYNEEKGEMIDVPPSWYKKIKEKCEKEPNKLHIVFFDELTNAMPSIQGMAFNIILDKEVNGVWKLPSNCRIVAAGNDMDDSLSANEMAEPLFNRFAHVYIETTVEKWLRWAAKPENHIHPAIYAYISYKNNSGKGSEVLRTKFNGKTPNADPRKWEMASKVLYTTGKPKMLEGLIGSELTKDFCEFCNRKVVTVDRVINNQYTDELIKVMKGPEMFVTALNMSKCEEKDLKVVREFVSKLGDRQLAMFDVLWSKGEEKRLEKIAKLRLENNTRR